MLKATRNQKKAFICGYIIRTFQNIVKNEHKRKLDFF